MPSYELDSYHIKEEMKRFMEFVETKIKNERQPLYEANCPETIYYTSLKYGINDYDKILSYGYEIIYQK